MRFSMPMLAAASLASATLASATPAEAALWLVTGTGEGRVTWCSSVSGPPCGGVLSVQFDFVVDEDAEGGLSGESAGYITKDGLWLRLADQFSSFYGRRMVVEGEVGTDKPHGLGWISYTNQERYARLAGEGSIQLSAVRYTGTRRANDFTMNVAAVPEPETWLAMILGFGLVGASLRKRRSARAFQGVLNSASSRQSRLIS